MANVADVESAIVTRLAAVSAVTTIVSTRIEPMYTGQTTALPCVSYQRIGGGPINVMGTALTTTTVNTQLQVDCWALTYTSLVSLANAVKSALSGWSSAVSTPPISSVQLLDEEDVPIPVKPGESTPIVRRRMSFSIWHT